MRIIEDTKLSFSDVLIVPKRSSSISRSMINLNRDFMDKNTNTYYGSFIPIIVANMDHTGTFSMARALAEHNCMTALHKFYNIEELCDFFKEDSKVTRNTFYSLGVTDDDIEKLKIVLSKRGKNIHNICVDVANGGTDWFVDKTKRIKDIIGDRFLLAGNVTIPNMVEELILSAGVTMVKCQVGPGSVCQTRVKAAIGYGTLSAVLECADAAHGLNKFICSDGGCNRPGDVAVAFGGGADAVMIGGMFAGHDQCSGEIISKRFLTNELDEFNNQIIETKKYKQFYGMSSEEAQKKHYGKMETYKASEGKCVLVPYRGNVDNTIYDLLGGIRSTCTYVGAKTIKDLPKCTTFIKVNQRENNIFGN